MKHLTHWILALALLGSAGSFSEAWTSQDPPPVQKPPRPDKVVPKKLPKPPGGGRNERHAAIQKALSEMKTSLVEAIGLAEKEAAGKAFSAGVEVIKGKPSIQVNLFVGEKFTVANVDPETKLVTIQQRKGDKGDDPKPEDPGAQEGGGADDGDGDG